MDAIPMRRHRNAFEVRQLLAVPQKRFVSNPVCPRRGALPELPPAAFETFLQSAQRRSLDFHRSPSPKRAFQLDFVEVAPASQIRFLTATPPAHPSFPNEAGFYCVALAGEAVLEIPRGFCPRVAEFLLRLAANTPSR